MTAGHSGAPLAKKLGVDVDSGLCLLDAPPGWAVPDLPAGVTILAAPGPDAAVTVAFCRDRAALATGIDELGAAIFPDRSLWIAWPRKAAGHVSDLDENGIREEVLPRGLVDIKVAAIDTDWSGLKIMWRRDRRPSARPRAQ